MFWKCIHHAKWHRLLKLSSWGTWELCEFEMERLMYTVKEIPCVCRTYTWVLLQIQLQFLEPPLLTYCTVFLALLSIRLCYTEPKKKSYGVAILSSKLFMLILLYVFLEDQHVNTLEAGSEDSLTQAARSFWCFLGERGCLKHRSVKLIPLHPLSLAC